MASVSGVTLRMWGAFLLIFALSARETSPCRMAWRIGVAVMPRSSRISRTPARGSARFFWISFARDLRGEI